jgi:sigma-B regulation protein RsbU (phosphoserine phosphatase)
VARPDIEGRLANLRALTDTALTRLDVDHLLVELLNRVREILDADTAAVLLIDETSGQLEARAACGIEEEVRQCVHVPLGRGFAGRIAESRGPIALDRVDETTVSNPILWEKGIQVMLGVPLFDGERVIGVLHVGRLEERPFGVDDVDLLEVVADRVANATRTRQLAIERAAARLFERSLLPSALPVCPGLEFSARYVPAEGRTVGGDWYDLFTLENGQLWIVAGDVAGHGVQAAVVMGRIRSALRAYTLIESRPERVLELVDRKVRHFEIGGMATVACAMTEPPYDSITVSLAGHPRPAVARPGRATALADVAPGPPLGMWFDVPRDSETFPFERGSVVVFYTDGLIERRGEPLDVGFDRLCAAVAPHEPNRVTRDLMRALVGTTIPEDDIAFVVARRRDDGDE